MKSNIYDIDDFWDLSARVSTSKENSSHPFSTSQLSVVVEDGVQTEKSAIDATPLTCFSESRSFTEDFYIPTDAPLIHKVTIRHFNDRYDFYDGFRKSAMLYYDVRGTKCDFVPFYSYMPQYTQMNKSQMAYYFYLRDEIRRGNYIRADYSYIYLYVYEILNLPEKIPPNEGIQMMCNLWRAYRKDLPRIDKYFSLWVEDYCLVWKLPAPTGQLSDFIFDILKSCPLRELYFSDIREACLNGALSLVSLLSDYDWRSGRYATGESARTYRAHMEGALSFVLSAVLEQELSDIQTLPTQRIARDAFVNSLCTHSVKCRLEIEYHSLDQLASLREKITNLVRYVENQLRRQLGVKSRLSIKNLPDEYMHLVDMYFNSVFAQISKKTKAETVPEYEKHYDAPTEELSAIGAREIEEASWETTFRLVADMDECDVEAEIGGTVSVGYGHDEMVEKQVPAMENGCSDECIGNLKLVLQMLLVSDDNGAKAFSLQRHTPLESYVDKINESLLEVIGDIVVENDGFSYRIIEDYREDIEEWLSK